MSCPSSSNGRRVTAVACSNFALCKYWGKTDADRNLPAVPSLSMTVDALTTRTVVEVLAGADDDEVTIDGALAPPEARRRVCAQLDRLRLLSGGSTRLCVDSANSFPAGAGLASSASAFAALTAAAARALGLELSLDDLSDLARQGSCSAARSIHGGFVELDAASAGTDRLCARPVVAADGLRCRMLVVITSVVRKDVGSTEGMNQTALTSPYFEPWVRQAPREVEAARGALIRGDLEALGDVVERSALRMHACAMAAVPGILYWNPATVALVHEVRRLRAQGLCGYFTIDAGPSVKILCAVDDCGRLREALGDLPGVIRVLECAVGGSVLVT